MKKFQKSILPVLIVGVVGLIYIFYLSPQKGLGSFDDIDPNAHVQKEIKVKLLAEEGINRSGNPAQVIFSVLDAKGRKVEIAADITIIPEGFEQAEFITVVGHFHGPRFDAVEVKID